MNYLTLLKNNRTEIIELIDSKVGRADLKECMSFVASYKLYQGDNSFLMSQHVAEGGNEESYTLECVEEAIVEFIHNDGRKASFKLEEAAIEANNKLKRNI